MNAKQRPPSVVVCARCGQRGDRLPGFRLDEYQQLEAVFVDDESVPTPQRLTCLACGHTAAVARGSIETRRLS